MPFSKKSYNFIDVINYSTPSIHNIDVVKTAHALSIDAGKRFFAYSSIFSRIEYVVRHRVTEDYLEKTFGFYSDEWKNRYLRDVARFLDSYFQGRGRWYKGSSRRTPILGVNFWPAQHGVWFEEGKAYNVLINPRKSLHLEARDVKFLARAIYELHGIDDPNNPDQLILDVSSISHGEPRSITAHHETESTAISLNEFEHIMRSFFEALSLAGMAEPPAPNKKIRDLLRK